MRRLVLTAYFLSLFVTVAPAAETAVTVTSVAELAAAAARDDQKVSMKPGVYRLTDYLSLTEAAARRARGEFQMMTFSGNNNTFELTGVTIEVDTALRGALRPPIHTNEFVVSGNGNSIVGLTINHTGNGTSPGGAALAVTGTGNTIRDCTLHVRGSFPYGYGDLFGKGGGDIIGHRKKSGLLVTGNGTTITGCKLYMHSFGHGYFVQKDAANVRFENCLVEGVVRPTSEMLAETSGPAFKVGFRTVAKNRAGENKVTAGYMKSLSEDGFRTYGQHRNLSLKNCTAKHMRGGFELRSKTAVQVENCTAIGNERGFWIASDAKLINCRGDSQYGPLLFVEGDRAAARVELLPTESPMTVHALASIYGADHDITIKAARDGHRTAAIPILIGYGQPMMGEGMAPIPERDARRLTLRNETAMPVVVGAKANGAEIASVGQVENHGRNVKITPIE